jgi:hypothetical protein
MKKAKVKTKAGYMHSIFLSLEEEQLLLAVKDSTKISLIDIFRKGLGLCSSMMTTKSNDGDTNEQVRTISHQNLAGQEI